VNLRWVRGSLFTEEKSKLAISVNLKKKKISLGKFLSVLGTAYPNFGLGVPGFGCGVPKMTLGTSAPADRGYQQKQSATF